MQPSDRYLTLLQEILGVQTILLETIRKQGDIAPLLEERQQLAAQVAVLYRDDQHTDVAPLREEIVVMEQKILRESQLQLDMLTHQVSQHQQDTRKMVRYFRSLIDQKGSGSLDLNV